MENNLKNDNSFIKWATGFHVSTTVKKIGLIKKN